MLTHHCDFISLDANIRASEVAQSSDSCDAGGVHQVSIVIQHVNIHSDLPHLISHTQRSTFVITVDAVSNLLSLPAFVCVLPSLLTQHTETLYRCTWSSSSISPAVCLASLTTPTVWRVTQASRWLKHPALTAPLNYTSLITSLCVSNFSSPALFECGRGHGWQLDVEEHDSFIWSTVFRSHQLAGHLSHDPAQSSPFTIHCHNIHSSQKNECACENVIRGSPGFPQIHKAAAIVSTKRDLYLPIVICLPSIQALQGSTGQVSVKGKTSDCTCYSATLGHLSGRGQLFSNSISKHCSVMITKPLI